MRDRFRGPNLALNLVEHLGSSYYPRNKDNGFWTRNLVQILALKTAPRLGALATYFPVPPTNEFHRCGDAFAAWRWYIYCESRVPLEKCALRANPGEIAVCRDQSSAGSPRFHTKSSRGGRCTCYASRRGQNAQRHPRHPARPTPATKNCPAKLAQSCARKHLLRKPQSLLVAAGFAYKGGRADWQWVGCLHGEVCCRRCKRAVARIIYIYIIQTGKYFS